jgi:adenosine deaminase
MRRGRRNSLAVCSLLFFAVIRARGTETPEQRTARQLESIRSDPSLLLAFLRDMPKGGDLHNHLVGAIYAESYIGFAARDGLCVDRTIAVLLPSPCDPDKNQVPAATALTNPVLYRQMIDAYSMRNFQASQQPAHDHFFDAFLKFDAATQAHHGEMLAEVISRAAAQHEVYLELMLGPGRAQAMRTAAEAGWEEDLPRLREKLMAHGLADAVAAGRRELDEDEASMREVLGCSSAVPALETSPPSGPDQGCGVTVRYIYDVLRGFPPEQVFAQMLQAFELARADPRMVAVNLVMPEDAYVPMRDFDLHMRMLGYLHGVYPGVHITLHAGELAPGLVPPKALRFHIRESIMKGHAERIGHGVDVMHEDDPLGLLREMAGHGVLVEICLTSNDMILGVRGIEHPLPMYLRYGVPVAICTDDEGVARSDLTWEYKRAVETYSLTYAQLKKMARDSLEHSFLVGASFWSSPEKSTAVTDCAGLTPHPGAVSGACGRFLESSEKARLQWKLEAEFSRFEKQF